MLARSLLLHAPGDLRWVTAGIEDPGPGEVLVDTLISAVSVGSELALYLGSGRPGGALSFPRMTGYESVGVVRAVGPRVRSPGVGTRVVATYGHRDRALVPADRAYPIPAELADRPALLAVLGGDMAHGVDRGDVGPGSRALVTGAGSVGLLATWVLRRRGVDAVDVVEPLPERRARALRLGARRAVAPDALAELDPIYHAGFECSDAPQAFELLCQRLHRGGRIVILADSNRGVYALPPAFHERELMVLGSTDCPHLAPYAEWHLREAIEDAERLAGIFDMEVEPDDLPGLFADLAAGRVRPVKPVVRYRQA